MSDSQKIKELRKKIEELERLVGQKQIQLEFKDKMIELAEEMYRVDIKKKLGTQRSSGSGSTEKNTPSELKSIEKSSSCRPASTFYYSEDAGHFVQE